MDLVSACLDRQLFKFCRLQEELVEWQDTYVDQSVSVYLRHKCH
jgi:hypothetical protein